MKLTKIILLISGLVLGANANSLCGNGVKDLGETCDPKDKNYDGWGNIGCTLTCKAINGNTCGNGIRDRREECDPTDKNRNGWGIKDVQKLV